MPGKSRPRRDRAGAQADPTTAALHEVRIETIGALASVLGHESRNLLGALETCTQILRRNPHLTPEDVELLDIIESGSRRLDEIVSEFAAFAHPSPLRFEPVDVHALIEETLRRLELDDRCAATLVVTRDFDPEVGSIEADREQLRQVVWHLLLNAAQALGDRGELGIRTRAGNKRVEIVVRDKGPGMPKRVRSRIFEPLFSTKSHGAGLGLPIVQRIVESHGGKITVKSDPDAGTSCVVSLPKEHR